MNKARQQFAQTFKTPAPKVQEYSRVSLSVSRRILLDLDAEVPSDEMMDKAKSQTDQTRTADESI